MKRVLLFITIAIAAVALLVVSLLHFDPAVETWSSLFAGIAVGLLIVNCLLSSPGLKGQG